jgi:hypothetical protein
MQLVCASAYRLDLLPGYLALEHADAAKPEAMHRGQGSNLVHALAGDSFSQCVIDPAFQSRCVDLYHAGIYLAGWKTEIKMKINGARHVYHAAVNH